MGIAKGIAKAINNLAAAAIVAGGVYAYLNWDSMNPGGGDELSSYAERACADEIAGRYDTQTVNVYAVNKNNKGFVVRASMTLTRGAVVKVTCLANENGRVEEVLIDER